MHFFHKLDYSTHRRTKGHNNEDQLKMARFIKNKMLNNPELAHRCPACSRCHNYIRNNGVARHSTRIRDFMEGY